ncbi:DUF2127 domain-containing protein [Sorangium cellulosum]|uniref:DUF2127 domain-containing protein n=1 Tax=Sorangium cellulosum TaxID=56 RepID=UPI000B2E03A1
MIIHAGGHGCRRSGQALARQGRAAGRDVASHGPSSVHVAPAAVLDTRDVNGDELREPAVAHVPKFGPILASWPSSFHGALAARAHAFAITLGRESASAWSAALMDVVSKATTPHGAHVVSAALAADSLIGFIEGSSLRHGYRWAPWLVVGATASLGWDAGHAGSCP